MKYTGKLIFFSLLVWGLLLVEALSDEIILKNGDRLTGEVITLEEEKLIFRPNIIWTMTTTLLEVLKTSTKDYFFCWDMISRLFAMLHIYSALINPYFIQIAAIEIQYSHPKDLENIKPIRLYNLL